MSAASTRSRKLVLIPALCLAVMSVGFLAFYPTEALYRTPEPDRSTSSAPALRATDREIEKRAAAASTRARHAPANVAADLAALPPPAPALPRFDLIDDTGERKREFYRFMYQMVEAENELIRSDRLRLQYLHGRFGSGNELSEGHREWLRLLSSRYRVNEDKPTSEILDRLLRRVDTIPEELAIAQAAIESAWGCSRFARLGNNIYGQWCFDGGCGIVPQDRDTTAKHEVAAFDSPRSSVRAYLLNLNTHGSYRLLRELRSQGEQGETPNGHALAAGLQRYSELGEEYIRRLRLIMRQNRDLLQVSRAEYSATEALRRSAG